MIKRKPLRESGFFILISAALFLACVLMANVANASIQGNKCAKQKTGNLATCCVYDRAGKVLESKVLNCEKDLTCYKGATPEVRGKYLTHWCKRSMGEKYKGDFSQGTKQLGIQLCAMPEDGKLGGKCSGYLFTHIFFSPEVPKKNK